MDVVSTLVGCVVGAALVYLGGYLRSKGTNLATKEDVADITKEIEQTKTAILNISEEYKEHRTTQIEIFMSFFDRASEFRYEKLAVNFGEFPSDEGKALYNYQKSFAKLTTDLLKAGQRLQVYSSGSPSNLVKTAYLMVNAALDASAIVSSDFREIKLTSIEEQSALESDDHNRYLAAVEKADKANREFWSKMRPHGKAFCNHYDLFMRELNIYLEPEMIKKI